MRQAVKGVNLGGWLVLEPWITPSLFKGSTADDEFTYCQTAGSRARAALRRHQANWITENDFQWLASHGITAVRIPVGYWIFGNAAPYVSSIKHLDKAFTWAGKHQIQVLLCLHGAPGSQNGEAHSGRRGTVAWDRDRSNAEISLEVLTALAQRYTARSNLLGIELLNEPAGTIPRRRLTSFYRSAYRQLRPILGPSRWVVFSDRFKPNRWWWNLHWPLYQSAVQDNHHYQIYKESDKDRDLTGHLRLLIRAARRLRRIAWHRKLVVGEWSAALDRRSLKGLDEAGRHAAYGRYFTAQQQSFNDLDGWFYWTYKTEDSGPWNFKVMVEKGIFKL